MCFQCPDVSQSHISYNKAILFLYLSYVTYLFFVTLKTEVMATESPALHHRDKYIFKMY